VSRSQCQFVRLSQFAALLRQLLRRSCCAGCVSEPCRRTQSAGPLHFTVKCPTVTGFTFVPRFCVPKNFKVETQFVSPDNRLQFRRSSGLYSVPRHSSTLDAF
jgi:hypothetical protein